MPLSKERLCPTNDKYDLSYDYVIVGGGTSAMGLLHGWLRSRSNNNTNSIKHCDDDNNVSIAVLERGGDPSKLAFVSDWARQAYQNSHESIPIGKGFGGSTNINAGWIELPSSDDFDTWPKPFSQQMYKSSRYLQNYLLEKQPKTTLYPLTTPDNKNDDTHWKSTIHLAVDSHQQKRLNYYQLLVEPLLPKSEKKSIIFHHHTFVERLLFNDSNTKCLGLECTTTYQNKSLRIQAKKKVILCSGAILTPALLLTSLPPCFHTNIGKLWKDHLTIPTALFFHWPSTIKDINSINSIQSYTAPITFGNARYSFCLIDGYCTIYIIPFVLYTYIHKHTGEVFSTILYWITTFLIQYTPLRWLIQYCTSTLLIQIYNTTSTGSITITKKRPYVQESSQKLSHHNIKFESFPYLTCPDDLKRIQTASLQWRKKHSNGLISSKRGGYYEIFPTSVIASFYQTHMMRRLALPFFHYTGTCAMPTTTTKSASVVNDQLYVHGISNLQICDASVIPTQISAPTALTCATIGYISTPFIFQHTSYKGTNRKISNNPEQ